MYKYTYFYTVPLGNFDTFYTKRVLNMHIRHKTSYHSGEAAFPPFLSPSPCCFAAEKSLIAGEAIIRTIESNRHQNDKTIEQDIRCKEHIVKCV